MPRPIHIFSPHGEVATSTTSGYRYVFDIHYQLSGLAFPGVVASIYWNADKILVPGPNRVETKITAATVLVYQEGFGWAKITELTGYEPDVTFSNRMIRFARRFVLEVSTNPVLKAIPMLGEADGTNRWVAEVHGTYDVVSGQFMTEFVWP
jgi:hypothetical protein